MPSARFEKIDKKKREKILAVAIEEFSKNEYEQVSINKIIQKADISRGSFYTYFEDKEDLFLYIVKDHINLIYALIKEQFDKNDKDIFETILSIVDLGIKIENNSIPERIVICASSLDGMLKKIAEMEIENKIDKNFDRGLFLTQTLYEESKVEYKKDFQDFYYILDILFRQALRIIHECLVYKKWANEEKAIKDFIDLKKKVFKRQVEIVKTGYLKL